MDTKATANYILSSSIELPEPKRHVDGLGLPHAHYMLIEISSGRVTGEKSHRWLGYAQCLLVISQALTLENCKFINKRN